MAETDARRSLRAGAAVMRSTADRFDAILSDVSLSEAEALDRLALEADELSRAMGTMEEVSVPGERRRGAAKFREFCESR